MFFLFFFFLSFSRRFCPPLFFPGNVFRVAQQCVTAVFRRETPVFRGQKSIRRKILSFLKRAVTLSLLAVSLFVLARRLFRLYFIFPR